MIYSLKGKIDELTPTFVILDVAGVGYEVNIALTTYTALQAEQEVKLFTTEIIREDAHLLFGFLTKEERALFELLCSVSGVGAQTARMILSTYQAAEVKQMIASGNSTALSKVKGLGPKTAQKIIVEIKDKVLKIDLGAGSDRLQESILLANVNEEVKREAVAALVMLGFQAAQAGKVVDKLLKQTPTMKVEQVIRQALTML